MVAFIARSGANSLGGTAEIGQHPEVTAFCERNRFERIDGPTTVEGDIAGMREYVRRLRGHMKLHAQYVAHEGALNHWRFAVANSPNLNDSPVVSIDGRVAGILLWELKDGMAVVGSRVVAPGYQ